VPIATSDLADALEAELSTHFRRRVLITELCRVSSEYRSSHALEDLSITLDCGSRLDLIFKDLAPGSLSREARRAKPAFLLNPLRELQVYVLRLEGTVPCYGAVADPQSGRYWLFLARVPGTALYQVGSFRVWCDVAAWLASFHDSHATDQRTQAKLTQALEYDRSFYRIWLERARTFIRHPGRESSSGDFERLAMRYEEVITLLLGLPRTVVHGEFFASNVLVREMESGSQVFPIDWEMVAIAPGLIDLAALTAGGAWSEGQKRSMAMAYYEAARVQRLLPGWPDSEESFLYALDCCRLHLAVQCLGWSNNWSAPPQHAHDWLGEALYLSKRLGVY